MIVQLALRNLGRNRRRSIVTILAIAAGFSAVNLFGGYVVNVFSGLEDSAIFDSGLGHLTIAKQGYFEEGQTRKEDFVFNSDELKKIQSILDRYPPIKLMAPRFSLSGLASNGAISTIFIADAIGQSDQRTLRGDGLATDSKGLLPEQDDYAVVLATDLAKALNLNVGDNAVLFTSTLEGQANAYDVVVDSIVNTGNTATNDKFVTVSMPLARDLLDNQGAEKLTILLDDAIKTQYFRTHLTEELTAAGIEVDIRTWDQLSSFYQQVRGMFSLIFIFIFTIVLTIVVMNIINTMSMTVIERTREIGTLRALGMQRVSVRRLFSTEGLFLSLIGCVAGILFSLTIAFIVNQANISYTPPGNSTPVPLLVNTVPVLMVGALLILTGLSTLFSILPARRAAKSIITEALGHV